MMTSYIIAMLYPGSRGETTGNTRYAKSKFFIAKYFAQNAGRQTCSNGAVTTAVTFLLHVPITRHSCPARPQHATLLPDTCGSADTHAYNTHTMTRIAPLAQMHL